MAVGAAAGLAAATSGWAVTAPPAALVRWDKVIVLMGLAREAGLATQHEQLDRSVFRVRLQDRRRRNA